MFDRFCQRYVRVPGVSPVKATVLALMLTACGQHGAAGDQVGSVSLAVTNVPVDVGCVRVRAVGSRSVEKDFDVKSGQSSILPMANLPVGTVDFYGTAFGGRCADVGAGASASWVGDPASALVEQGKTTQVTVVLRPNARGQVAVDFQLDPATGQPCVGDGPGCLDPADSSGAASDPIPDGARMVSPAEFGAALQGGLRLDSPRLQAKADDDIVNTEKQDREILSKLLAEDPQLLARVLDEPTPDERLRRAPDGNFLLRVGDKGDQEVVLMGKRFALRQVVDALTRFGSRENQSGIYRTVFDQLPPEEIRRRQLPTPDELGQREPASILELNLSLARDEQLLQLLLKLRPGQFPPPGFPATCANEEGSAPGLPDQTGGACTPAAGGVFGSSNFPLKWRSTCVKNQGNRGSCVSFGITAAVEAAVAIKHNRWLNLSEEKLYFDATVPRACGDGLDTSGVMSNMVASGFRYPWEHQWDYNPTYSRPYNSCPYVNSCTGYGGEHCSNTSHQGDQVCVNILFLRFCANDGSAAGSSNFRLNTTTHLFSLFAKPVAVSLARLFLAAGVPIVYSFDVVTSFDAKANSVTNGIVSYAGAGEHSRGGHAVALMGFIDNASLSAGTAPGAGGGYFVMKNSWGKCTADGGYLYIPYNWAITYGYSMSTAAVN